MDWKYSEEILKHLEKQREIFMEAYRSLSHELHRLQVEEDMLTRKLHEIISAEGTSGKGKLAQNTTDNREWVPPEASISDTNDGR